MGNVISESGRSLSEDDLVELERRLGCSLPAQYREFLLARNGGVPEKAVFDFEEDGRVTNSAVRSFLGVGLKYFDIDEMVDIYKREQNRMPSRIYPIGMDDLGNGICISVAGSDLGAVYFWDHEMESDPPADENLYLIAGSFDEFFAGLYLEDLAS